MKHFRSLYSIIGHFNDNKYEVREESFEKKLQLKSFLPRVFGYLNVQKCGKWKMTIFIIENKGYINHLNSCCCM